MKDWSAEDYMNLIRMVVIAVIVMLLTVTTGCVNPKVIKASQECSDNQVKIKVAKYQALADKMDSKDIIIDQLLSDRAGDPCANMLIAEINGKNNIISRAIGVAGIITPSIMSYKKDKEMFKALAGNGNNPSNITINAETGAGGEGGSSGYIGIHTAVGGSSINTGTQSYQTFDKGILGGEGSINDADTVTSDGVF